LELARLLLAAFDTAVMHIVAQPLLLVASVEGKQRKHIPDYLLLTNDGPVVVDVKPRQHLTKPVVVRTFTWTRKAVESRGWRYEVWSEAPTVLLENVRFLAGYRRARLFESALIDRMSSSDLLEMTVGEAIRKERAWPELMVRGALMHLLWRQHFTVDLTRPLTPDHVLGSAA
jgi:TnsA-like endonuclease N terminal